MPEIVALRFMFKQPIVANSSSDQTLWMSYCSTCCVSDQVFVFFCVWCQPKWFSSSSFMHKEKFSLQNTSPIHVMFLPFLLANCIQIILMLVTYGSIDFSASLFPFNVGDFSYKHDKWVSLSLNFFLSDCLCCVISFFI